MTSVRGRSAKTKDELFASSSTGIMSGRDEWAYSFSTSDAENKAAFLHTALNNRTWTADDTTVKWSESLKQKANRGDRRNLPNLRAMSFRPFTDKIGLDSDMYLDRVGPLRLAFSGPNIAIAYLCVASSNSLCALAVSKPFDYGLLKQGNGGTQGIYRYRYVGTERLDNITDWALEQFTAHYGPKVPITKDDIFHYVYAVLHDPVYRDTYALNLRREFPRIPFYTDFPRWAAWGKTLMDLHIGYEAVEPWPLQRTDAPMRGGEPLKRGKSRDLFEDKPGPSAKREADTPKVRLKADKDTGIIELDAQTQLSGVPPQAWTYRLGNRSALEWVLDQHKEKKPFDPTIREKFDTYRFADHKERVVDLLGRVCRVSVETVAITEAMRSAAR